MAQITGDTTETAESDGPRLVVALGASAGGLESLKQFFAGVPPDLGAAYVVVQHLDPNHESLLADLLGRHLDMPVTEVEDGMSLAANRVHTIPPGQVLTVRNGILRLAPSAEGRGARFPVDTLFSSLAEDRGDDVVAVVLSGTGTDGTAGIKAVKARGGTVMAEDPATAEHAGMPRSAVATGVADVVRPVDVLGEAVAAYARHLPLPEGTEAAPTVPEDGLGAVVDALKDRAGPDFRAYKAGTLTRRIHRRMGLLHLDGLDAYVRHLKEHPAEADALRRDLLISVTEFFRDPDAYAVLQERVVPDLVPPEGRNDAVRVWVPGCATGEEPYSLSMLLAERQRDVGASVEVQMFATDVSEEALQFARAGVYPEGITAKVPPELRRRYLVDAGRGLERVSQELREPVAFAVHDLLRDPPFAKMDLISCRNLLIYLKPEVQEKVLALFHYALKPGGYLFLGGSESVGRDSSLFEPVSKKWRVYRRVGPSRRAPFPPTASPAARQSQPVAELEARAMAPRATEPGLTEKVRAWLLAEYAPAAVVIDRRHAIVYLHGPVGRYLDLPRGEPVLDLLSMLRDGLQGRVRAAIHRAFTEERAVQVPATHVVEADGERVTVAVRVVPILRSTDGEGLAVVTFEEVGDAEGRPPASPTEEEKPLVHQLEAELKATKAELHGTISALEVANEELRASNEEILSMNEEFRTTNEELETSKEELQSVNEELTAVNTELREKVDALESARNDIQNLLTSTSIATLFLDRELCIRRFTPAMTRLVSLIPGDVGRPFSDVTHKFTDPAFDDDVRGVLDDLVPRESEVKTDDGHRFVRRLQPYRTEDDRIQGVVATFVDVEALKRAQDALADAKAHAEAIVQTVIQPLVVLDADLRVISVNPAFAETFKVSAEETIGKFIYDVGNRQWDIPELRRLLEEVLPEEATVSAYEVDHEFPAIGRRIMLVSARTLIQVNGNPSGILLAVEDATDRKLAEQEVAALNERLEDRVRTRTAELEDAVAGLRQRNEALDAFTFVVGHDLKEPVRALDALLGILAEDHGDTLPDEAQRLLRDARAATARLATLVTGLLAFSRASRMDVEPARPVRLGDLLAHEACTGRFGAVVADRGTRLELPAADVEVMGEPAALCQILGNVVLNAVVHNPADEPWVRVTARPTDNGMVEVVVDDDGPGIPENVVANFEDLRAATRGFGLAIAKRMVMRLGGTMWLAARDGGGASVHFTLPAPPEP